MTLPVGIRGRLVALGLLLLPVILLLRFLLWPLAQSFLTQGDDLTSTRERIAHYQRLLNEMPALQAAAARLERASPLAPYLLSGKSRALAAADLQQRLKDTATKKGVMILSTRVSNPETDGPLERISVEARLRADIRQLRDLLYEIEVGTPYLFVADLIINGRQGRTRARAKPGTLEVNLTLYGLRAPGVAAGPGAENG